jgi:hypothetical protein
MLNEVNSSTAFKCTLHEDGYPYMEISKDNQHLISLPYQSKAEKDYVQKLLMEGELLNHIDSKYQNKF